jgi:predicted ATPase
MVNSSQQEYGAAALDPDLLSTPFMVQTNWHVITGAISSGITTLIGQLADQGFQTVPEAPRQYMEQEMAKGRSIDAIRANPAVLQRGINDIWRSYEHGLSPDEVLFLDRALPDALAFSRVNGLNPNELLADCFAHHYASVFILDRLPVHQDGVRYHDDLAADLIEQWLARDYTALGYNLVRVPVLPVEERSAFVLENLAEQGLL